MAKKAAEKVYEIQKKALKEALEKWAKKIN
jgi:hypothetical protein